MVTRLINAHRSEIQTFTGAELKQSIWDSEGRVILAQNFVAMAPLSWGTTNPELAQAMGADMVFLNGYSLNPDASLPGLMVGSWASQQQYRLPGMRDLVDVPLGVYLECGVQHDISNNTVQMQRSDRAASAENLAAVVGEGANFVVLGGNPGTGTSFEGILAATKLAKEQVGDKMLVFAGKWEDGAKQPVLGDPTQTPDYYKNVIAELIDAGADVVCLPMPGSRWGIDVAGIRDLVTFIHTYRPGTLALAFLDGTVEGSDTDTVRQCGLWSKATGADIHAIGDAGLGGMSVPENIYQLAITIKGRAKTWERMAVSRR